jgi:hypothetical protein
VGRETSQFENGLGENKSKQPDFTIVKIPWIILSSIETKREIVKKT